MNQPMQELPQYKSHKIVHALKIHNIDYDETGQAAVITPEEDGYGPFGVDADYMHKHKPRIGGYYVVYEDGYKSWSPKDAFEKGYVKLDGDHSPLSELQAALQADEDYAWTWFCNLACIGMDSVSDVSNAVHPERISAHEASNRRAAQFMKNAFGVDVRTQEHWKRMESQWVADAALSVVPPSFSSQCDTLLTKLQSVIDSRHKRTYAEMKNLADRLTDMGVSAATMVLGEVVPD